LNAIVSLTATEIVLDVHFKALSDILLYNSRRLKIQLSLESGQGGQLHFQPAQFLLLEDIACSDLGHVTL
jgi:hypothetical protein